MNEESGATEESTVQATEGSLALAIESAEPTEEEIVDDGEYFEYLLTRFTEPSEVFGPIDIAELRAGRYLRRDRGKLPTARLVFLDEIFKANSAILNSLLTVINERKFYQDGQPVPVKLRVLLAATNELPENAELAALKDRFCLKAACRSVQGRSHRFDAVAKQ